MEMPFPPTHCCRCCQPNPEFRYTVTEWRFAEWMQHTINFPIPLCKKCYVHTLSMRRKKMMIATVLTSAAIIGIFTIQKISLGGNLLIETVIFFAYIAAICLAGIWGIPKLLRPDFLEIDYKPVGKKVLVKFTNADYQTKVEQLDKLANAAEGIFKQAAKRGFTDK